MAVNKVIFGGETVVDLTTDTVTPDTLAEGVTAHDKSGARIVGTMTNGGNIEPAEDDIPKVFFGSELPQTKDDTIMSFRYISKTRDIIGYCKTKAQGSSSMNYPKKNQTVKIFKDAECTEKLKVNFKNWSPRNEFCFKANWIDLTHARNIVTARLWGDVVKSRQGYENIPELLRTSPNQGAIDGFPVKVYAGGVYQGRYTINIPKAAWMANMDDSMDTNCILCGESNVDDRSLFRATANIDGSDWSDEVHDTVPDAIKTRWNEAINFIVNSTDEDFVSGIGNYFDVDSLIDYYLFGLATCGLDAFGKNQLYMTYDGQQWYATMYDLDSTWGLWWDGSRFVAMDYARADYQDFKDGNGNLLYIRVESLFADAIKVRWEELKSGALSIDNIINRFERFTDIASTELVKEDYAETTADGLFTGIPSQNTNNIQQIRNYAVARLAYCESYINQTSMGEEYTIVEYIQSDGTQYIDTGISGGTNAAYEIKLQVNNTGNWELPFHGVWKSEVPNIGVHISGWMVFESNGLQFDPHWNLPDENAHTIRYESNFKMYKDNAELSIINNTADTTYPGAGWGNDDWKVCENSMMKLYFLKMYTDGALVRDFVPVKRNSDGVYGLYDNVTKTFFASAGTGTFAGPTPIVSSTYTIVEYIQSDGSQYIDTGISGGENAAYEICLQVDNAGNWEKPFHGEYQSEVPDIGVHISGWMTHDSKGVGFDPHWNLPDDNAHTVRYDSDFKMYKDGTELSFVYNTAGTTYPGCGWGNVNWRVCENSIMKLYFLKMHKDGALVRDFVPVKRNSDGVYGLYDNVSQTFFGGSGVFTGA